MSGKLGIRESHAWVRYITLDISVLYGKRYVFNKQFSADASSERSKSLSSHSSDEISIGYQDEFVPFRPLDGHDLTNDPNHPLRDNRIEKPLAVVPPLPSLPWEISRSQNVETSPGLSQKLKYNGQQKFIHT